MAKVIGLSGPQGGGKSTLLNGLQLYGIKVDDFKVSRSVQKQLGWESLDRATKNIDDMLEFQNEIKRQKFIHDGALAADDSVKVILVERTFADIDAYFQLWLNKFLYRGDIEEAEHKMLSKDFGASCKYGQQIYYANMILPYSNTVKWENDPSRAKQEDLDAFAQLLDYFFLAKNPKHVLEFTINQITIDGRIKEVYDWLKGIK
jgi:hypothetical protein